MAVYKIKKTENFVVLDKGFLQDASLSWQAKGILALLLSRPADWEVHVSELLQRATNGEHSTRSALNELKTHGYIVFIRNRQGGQFSGSRYYVFEQPQLQSEILEDDFHSSVSLDELPENLAPQEKSPHCDFPHKGNPHVENPHVENPDGGFPHRENQRLLNNNTTKNNNNKERAAEAKEKPWRLSKSQVAAAATFLSVKDGEIGSTLTPYQINCLEALAQEFQPLYPRYATAEALYEELAFEVLDDSFTQCGRDFSKKINVLRKAMQQKKWFQSKRWQKEKTIVEAAKQDEMKHLRDRYYDVRCELNSLLNEQLLCEKQQRALPPELKTQLQTLQAEYEGLKQQLGLE